MIEKLSWPQIRQSVREVNPELAEIIDDLDPDDSFSLFRVKYPFGAEILKRGTLHLPMENGDILPITDQLIPKEVRDELSYNLMSNPVTLVLKNTCELFTGLHNRTTTLYGYGMIPPGRLFGTFRILSEKKSHQPKFIWDMTAGARSIFMLPKISEAARHNKLKKKYHIHAGTPKSLAEHWQVFREIAAHPSFPEPWQVELLYFSEKWFTYLNDRKWLRFSHFLYRNAWNGAEFSLNSLLWDLTFSIMQETNHIKPDRYVDDTVRYLLALGAGAVSGFSPATNSLMAPISGLQSVYLNDYQLKDYHPTIMQFNIFELFNENPLPVYYSLRFANASEFSIKSNEKMSLITELCQISSLLRRYKHELALGKYNIEETPLNEVIHKVKFDFFHVNSENYSNISHSRDIAHDDPRFQHPTSEGFVGEYPAHSSFFRGCMRISK